MVTDAQVRRLREKRMEGKMVSAAAAAAAAGMGERTAHRWHDLALECRIDPDPSDAPARRLDPRVRLTRGAIHRDIVSHIRRLDRPAKHPTVPTWQG